MKRLFVMMLCGLLLATSIPSQSFAADAKASAVDITVPSADPGTPIREKDPAGSSVEPTTAGLENAILSVKEKIVIPENYSEFNYYFYDTSSYSDAYWSFTWSNPSDHSSIQVNCDADCHITSFYKYDAYGKITGVSKYLKKELKSTADEFIIQIAPELKNKLKYIDATFDGIYSGNYVYSYQRTNNGVNLPDNTVSVSVNSVSGEVVSASINWLYDVKVPSSTVKLTKEEAAKLIKDNLKMKLIYRTNYYGIYDKFGNRGETKAFLVYEPTLNYISVDAKTGEVYLDRSQWITINRVNGGTKEEAAALDSDTGSTTRALTEEEIAKIEELKKLVSKDKAIDIITSNKSLYLEDTLKSYSATLNKTETARGKTSYVWNISLNDPKPINYQKETDNYRAYAYATVDAQTGKILSFNASMKGYYNEETGTWDKVSMPYDKEEGRVILEKFLKSQIKDRFASSVLVNTYDGYVAYYDTKNVPVYGGYSYQYNRTNEGVEYPYNNIYGSVDGVSGKIYSFGSYWDDNVVFESTEGAMSADKAIDYYLGNEGYGLKYEINAINKYDASYEKLDSYYDYTDAYSVEYQIRLVYRPDVTPAYISPFTGERLNYDGQVYKETAPYSYLDIEDTPQNRNVLLMADMNIGFEGDYFLPDQAITVGEMNKLLSYVGYGYSTEDTDNEEKQITREELALSFIKRMGLERVSKLSGIYKTGYTDENSIGSEYLGAVALAKGYGLMTGDADNNFNAKANITRFEAVDLIMNFIAVQQKGILY